MNKNELEQAYLNTVYSVFADGSKYDIKIGEVHSKDINVLFKNTKSQTGVIMTAWNPRSQHLPIVENKTRNAELADYFTKNNLIFYDALGQGQDSSWTPEQSFFIKDISKEMAESLAVEYGQNAYVWIEENMPVSLIFSAVWNE